MSEPRSVASIIAESMKALGPLKDVLPTWYSSLQALADGGTGERLRLGVIGVTSSGKSTFINALLGEELLPEQSQATTNVPVICRRDSRRRTVVTFRSGRVSEYFDDQVNAELFHLFCSEDGNKNNHREVRHLSLYLPNCCLQAGLEIIDTPGVDAYDGQQHEDITLYECIPTLDIILYMTHIVRPFAASDLKLVKRVIEHDQRVLFAISHKDVEVDDFEKNQLFRTKEEKLQNHINELRKKLKRFPGISDAEIVAVSSLSGKRAHGDHSSADWKESNIGSVMESLHRFSLELNQGKEGDRAARLRKTLTDLIAAVEGETGALNSKADQTTGKADRQAQEVKVLDGAAQAIEEHLARLEATAASALAKRKVIAEIQSLFQNLAPTDTSGLRLANGAAAQKWSARRAAVISGVDEARAHCRSELDKLGIAAGRGEVKHNLETEEFPSLETRIERRSRTYKVDVPRSGVFGKFRDWWSGTPQETRSETTTTFDVSLVLKDLENYLSGAILSLSAFAESQKQLFRELYLKPVERRLKEQRDLLSEGNKFRDAAEAKKFAVPLVLERLRMLVDDLQWSARSNSPPSATEEQTEAVAAPARPVPVYNAASAKISSIMARARESVALSRFWRVATAAAGGKPLRRLLVAGLDTEDAEKLVGYLTRCRQADDLQWSTTPDGIRESTVHHALGDTCITVAPTDADVATEVVQEKCAEADAIALQFDGTQPAAGLNRLVGLKDYVHFSGCAEKVFLVFPGAAAYDTKLNELVTQAIARVKGTPFSSCRWYLYEAGRYDSRYTDFLEIVSDVLLTSGPDRSVVRQWKMDELSHRAPFGEQELCNAYNAIREREMQHGQ